MYGCCSCKNIKINWQLIDLSLVPRACQCSDCLKRNSSYVSKAGTSFSATFYNKSYHRIRTNGFKAVEFHECSYCKQCIFVTSEVDGVLYGAISADCLLNKKGFSEPVNVSFARESLIERLSRIQQNWCRAEIVNL
jgi:hypothetical protein